MLFEPLSTSRFQLQNDYSSKSSFQSDPATPTTAIQLVLDTLLPFYRQWIDEYIYIYKRGEKPMKNIVIREKSRKMSRGGYDAPRSNRRITLDDGQLFSGYIYIRRPITGNRGSSCSCSKWSDRVCRGGIFFYWLPGKLDRYYQFILKNLSLRGNWSINN